MQAAQPQQKKTKMKEEKKKVITGMAVCINRRKGKY